MANHSPRDRWRSCMRRWTLALTVLCLFVVLPARPVAAQAMNFTTIYQSSGFFPEHIAADATGNLYVADPLSYVIWKFQPSGAGSVFAGTLGSRGFATGAPGTGQFY